MLHIVRNKFLASSLGRAFVVALVFVTFAALLFWLDYFRSYSAEVTVLVVSKSGITDTSSNVADNIAELTRTLSFYDRLLSDNDLIDDDTLGYAPDKRKEYWQNLVMITKQNGSGVLVIRAKSDTPETAKRIALQTAQTMFSVAGLYYNVKTDVDMRIVDGPFVSYVLQKPYLYFGTSLLTSFTLTALFFFLLRTIPIFFVGKKGAQSNADTYSESEKMSLEELASRRAYPEFGENESVPWIDPKKFIPEKPQVLSFEASSQEGDTIAGIYPPVRNVKHAQAPLNLPTADDAMNLPVADEVVSLPFEFEAPPEELEPPVSQSLKGATLLSSEAVESDHGEPTQEEYRRRLNELLAHTGK
jgi:hypothetical protein